MNEFKCPKCDSSFSIRLAHVFDDKGKAVTGQPVIACECEACVFPYMGEQANQEIIAKLEQYLS
jgi:hypothetical protein